MQGIHENTGKFIDDTEHLTQSIKRVLNTPLGSRVMLPEFGSEVVDLIDAPMTPSNRIRLYAATIEALQRWEPRLEIESVQVQSQDENGKINLKLTGIYDERNIVIENVPIG